MTRFCVCASVFSDFEYFIEKGNVLFGSSTPKMTKPHDTIPMDYYLFTNIPTEKLVNHVPEQWQIILIPNSPDPNIQNQTQLSRYFKFQLHHYFSQQNKHDYDWIIYLDHYLHLDPTVDWNKIVAPVVEKISDTELALIQTFHKDQFNSIYQEAQMIISGCADSSENVNKALQYLQNFNKTISLNQPIVYRENWLFLYSPKHTPTIEHFDLFWKHYLDKNYGTKRDQPLWNYLLHYREPKVYSTVMNLIQYIRNEGIVNKYGNKFS